MKNRSLRKTFAASVLIMLAFLFGCKKNRMEAQKEQILERHHKLIAAHFEKNPDFFAQRISEQFISVKNGEITRPGPEDITAQMRDYINNTTFSEYRDLREPIIGFSKDGSVAWSIVQVKVKGDRRIEDGTVRKIEFICAWLTLYEKSEQGWNALAEVSTFR